MEAVISEADALAAGPQLPYLLAALGHDLENLADEHATPLLAAVADGLREPHSAWALSDALDILCIRPALATRLGARTIRDLVAIAERALAGESDAALAQPAIAGLLRLALSGQATPHRLLAILTEITGTEPVDALERLPILIGVAHDNFADTDELLDVLIILENGAALAPATRADATFELAIADERAALEAIDRTVIDEQLRKAQARFAELDRANEARMDARVHAIAIEAVLAFTDLFQEDSTINDSARERLARAANDLDTTAAHLTAWTGRMHELDWLSARGLTRAAWSRLAVTLHAAQVHLDQPSWYDPVGALEDLLQIYLASRSVHAIKAEHQGLKTLISPTIEAPFIRGHGLRHQLEQALLRDARFTDHPDAQALYKEITRQRQQSGSDTEDVVPGKLLEERPALAGLFQRGGKGLRGDIDPHLLDELERRAVEVARGHVPTGNARFDAHLDALIERLTTSPAWQPPENHYFVVLLEQFLRFLYDRFDAQADLYGDRTAYLGPPKSSPDGSVRTWREKHLQDDFHQHLSGVLTPGTVQRELSDVAGGRTDVTYTPVQGCRLVTEIKWRTTDWTPERIEQTYIAQAANYTATGPPFGIILVGDSSDHSAGYSDLDDRIWIATHARSATEIPRRIVIGVLPTGRPTPSGLRA